MEMMDPRIAQVILLVKDNLQYPLRRTDLARRVSLSASRFAHLFKLETGSSPAEHIKLLRLTQAREFLKGTSRSIKDIALSVGYDQSHFTRDFKSVFGATPSGYRAQGHSSVTAAGASVSESHP